MSRQSSWRRWARVFRQDPRSEVDEELHYHIEQRIHEYVARGMDPETARKSALERIGDVERVRDECTGLLAAERRVDGRRMALTVSWLDVKLGVRMLSKYPGLSLVSVLGMAVAIAIGAGVFGVISAIVDPTLPLPGGDRIVAILSHRADRPGDPETRVLHDVVVWRTELTTVRDLGAFRLNNRNLIIEGRGTELVDVAEMSAAGFRVAQVPALLGPAHEAFIAGETLALDVDYAPVAGGASGAGVNVRVGVVKVCEERHAATRRPTRRLSG